MSLIAELGTAAEATETFVRVVQDLNGSRSVVLHVENYTAAELVRVAYHHAHGEFQLPPERVIPPRKADVFSSRDKAFSLGTGTEGWVTYAGPGFFLTVRWTIPFLGNNDCGAGLADDLPGRYAAHALGGGGNTKAHMRYEVRPLVREFGSVAEKVEGLRADGWDLGAETGPEMTAPDGAGRFQHFEHFSVFWSPGTGAHEVHGAIREKYKGLGWQRYGYPFTDEMTCPDGVGKLNHFQQYLAHGVFRGSIYWHPQLHPTDLMLAAHEVRGEIRAKWAELNWEQGFLGYPVTDEMDWGGAAGGRVSEFQGGTIVWDPQNRARVQTI